MSISRTLSDHQAFNQFTVAHPELASARQITALTEESFVQQYASEFVEGAPQARRVYQFAKEIHQHTALLWANLKDIASPFLQSTVFNNIPASFLDHQQSIPGYDRLFGNLDHVECEPCRSVFGPAAYFVDLMRFIEETITNQNTIPPEHQLDRRRPDLFNLKLDCTNTDELIPYIDLVNQILETIVTNSDHPDAAQVLDQASFPCNLPYNEPLEAIRTYLNQLKLNLSDLYQTFETASSTQAESITRELLSLSPREFDIIRTELTTPEDISSYYGLNTTQTLESLATVSTFLEQTGLSRQELTDLIFQDLSQEEVKSGLTRQFFINQAEDGLDYLQIEEEAPQPGSFYQVPQERLVNLSLAKLDRIYRFVKLARKLNWSFADLDWALHSLQPDQFQERGLRFDGINDAVTVENATKLNDLTEFTIEAWVYPGQAQANPIVYKGGNANAEIGSDVPQTHFLFGLDANNRLVLVSDHHTLAGSVSVPLNQFSHVAVTITASQVAFYVNGEPESLQVYRITPEAVFQLTELGVPQPILDQFRALVSTLEGRVYTQDPFLTALRTRLTTAELNSYQAEILAAMRSTSQPFLPVGTTLILGADCGSSSFAGIFQEVRIWRGGREAGAIAANRDRRLTGQEPELVAYWPLIEESSGTENLGTEQATQVSDRATNPNHGILGGTGAQTRPRWVDSDLVLHPAAATLGASNQFNDIPEEFSPDRITVDQPLLPPLPIAVSGTVLELDGDNDVVVIHNPANTGLGHYERLTLELWFRPLNLTQRNTQRQILYSQGDAKAGLSAYLFESRLHVMTWCEDETQNIQETLLQSEPLSDQWHHLAITNDTTRSRHFVEFRAYLNGNELAFVSSNHPNNANLENHQKGYPLSRTEAAYLGGIGEQGISRFAGEFNLDRQHYFAGQVTDLRLWNRVKTRDEIDADRHTAPTLPDPNLIAYLPMDEGIGNVLHDRSQTGNHYEGTLQSRNLVFLTDSSDSTFDQLHSYYNPTNSSTDTSGINSANDNVLSWTNYAYIGRVYVPAQFDRMGVTVLSRRPENRNRDYRLQWQRSGNQISVQLVATGGQPLVMTVPASNPADNSASNPVGNPAGNSPVTIPVSQTDRWYRFRIEVENNTGQNRTDIRARVWQEDTEEPQTFPLIVQDNSPTRIPSGTVGIWTTRSAGTKQFDDLQVISLFNQPIPTVLLAETFDPYKPNENPSGWVEVGDRHTTVPPEVLLDENFESYNDNQDPRDWRDTGENYGLTINGNLFKTSQVARNKIFRTTSSANNIHSHYIATGASRWNNYVYSGRLLVPDISASGIGVTVLSQYPNADGYYRLGRLGGVQTAPNQARFHLSVRRAPGSSSSPTLDGQVDSGITPRSNTWYRFRIEVEDEGDRTRIRAKIWEDGTPEPQTYSMNATDQAIDRLGTGTVGLWAAGNGEKRFDDLRVQRLETTRLESVVDDRLFRTADAQDNAARWQTISTYPLLLRPLSHRALRFNGQTEYLAANNLKGLAGNQFTIATWINPAQRQSDSGQSNPEQPNPVFSWQDGTSSRFFWFGITATGNLTLFAEQPGNVATTGGIVGSTPIPVGQFTHIAVSVNGNSVTFFVNGNPEATQTFPVALSFNPTTLQVGRFFNTYLAGELRDLRLWNTAQTTVNLAIDHRYQQPDLSSPDLVGYWSLSESDGELALDTSVNTNHLHLGGIADARQPMLPGDSSAHLVPVPLPLTLDATTLQGLATLRQLQVRHNLPIDRLTSLWFEIRHTGRADGQTLFDRIFNGRGIPGELWTASQYPIDWTVTGQSRRDRQVRSRLMGALQVSSSDLDLLVQRLSGATIVIELDSQYLTRLYRLAQLAKVLRLTVQDFLRLLDLMNLTDVNTLAAFQQVSDRADWIQRTGLQVSELEFLTRSTLNSQISLPYTEATIRDLATTLTNQSSEFLVTPSSFVSDLVNLAQSMQIFDVLNSAGILDERGAVSLQDQPPVRMTGINGLPTDPAVLQAIQSQVEETLLQMQQEQANAIVERLAELFQVEPERLQIVHNHLRNHLNVTSSLFLGWMRDIVNATDSQPLSIAIRDYLNQLSRGLYLIDRFALTTNEAAHLLDNPDDFSITSVFNPTIADLERLVMFMELKSAFNDVNGGLIRVFAQATDSAIETAILDVTDWELEQFRALTNYFGNSSTSNRISQLHRLYRAFALADTLQVNIEFLIQLANTENLTIDFYRQQSAALLNVVRSRYDEEQWQRVYKPVRDRLATQKRDALLRYALTRQLPADFSGRRDADVLYEYLLLDVQIGSEVETSRIVQGTAALQLYVQRCLLNLEQGVNPATIPLDQWNWMKNYRVWEANRKVFLYPESYIEPELRNTKTPLFEELELELMQGEINQSNVEKALNNYLNKLAELADLKIVGSYLHRDDTTQAQTLYLVGRTTSQPKTYYYRELIVNENRWLPWERIDLAINAEFVSPVFAFNRLFLFWVEFTEISRQNPRSQANRTVYQPLIQFSYPDFNGAWVPPQPYAQDYRALEANERSRPEWQRVYALRTEREIPVISTAGNGSAPETRERILVVYGDMNRVDAAVEVKTLRNARDQEAFTLQLNGSAQNSSDLRLSPQFIGQLPRFLGHMTVSNLERLNQIAAGNTASRSQLRDVLNNLFDRPRRRIGLSQPPIVVDELPLNFTDNFRVERGSNHWAIVEGGARVVVRQMGDRLNVYQTSWFLGFMNLAFLSILDNLADRTADATEIAQLRGALNQLFDRSVDVQINVPEGVNFRVDKLRDTQWIVTYGNGQSQTERLLVWQANDRLDVYSFSTDFLSSFLNTFSSIKLESNVRLDVLENNQLLFTDNDRDGSHQEYLLVPSNRESFDVYRRSTASLYTASINAPGINEYTLALAPNQAPTSTPQPILNQLPLEASLLDVNNQPGWYILDTGEEQFLLQAAITTTDADRLQFTAQSPRTQLSFQAAPLPQTAQFNTLRLDTTAVRELSLTLFQQGIDGLLSLRSQQIQERRFANYRPNSQVTSLPSDVLDFNGTFGLYYQEIFFHIPFFIANQLNANQDFAGAQRWYHYIFNPTSQESVNGSTSDCPTTQDYLTVLPNRDRYWQYLPFRNRCVDSIARILNPQNPEHQAALAAYRHDPFDPHAIAQLRVNAYQKAIVMKYIDNLLDWGDFLFNQNNRESIGEAAQLYVLAYNLLGPRPEGRATRRFEEIGDYNAIRQVFNTPPDFLTEFPRNGALPVPQNGNILTIFCVTENADFVGFWDRVSDRLFKIRHSLNIDGVFRQLDLFQPPLDVRALVAAFASGNRDLSSILADVNRPVPHYRYGYMLDKAKEMTEIVIGLGEKLLEAIQNRDAEQLATLQNTHERTILDLMTATRQAELEAVRQEIAALNISRQGIQNRQAYYDNLVSGGTAGLALNGGETTDLLFTSLALGFTAGQSVLKYLGSFVAASSNATMYSTVFDLAGDGTGAVADGLAYTAQLAEKIGAYERRLEEWRQEQSAIAFELQEIDQQIAIANIRLNMAEHELLIHDRTIQQNQEIADFYRRKFSNEQLYNWMISRISGLYFQAYKRAYATAKDAERAFQYEFGDNNQFINFGHWDSLRRGLLAGESLQLDLMRLEKYAIDQDSRYQEIEKIISMRSALPEAFTMLRDTGNCLFKLTEQMFDQDYPGHFFRVIKSIAITVKSPELKLDQSLNATLIQLGNQTLLTPEITGVRYLMGLAEASPPDGAIRSNWRANQQIAISRSRDNGMFGSFDLNFLFDDRYFPFEGTGTVSSWQLEMPQARQLLNPPQNPPNQNLDVDVIIHLRYTSRVDRGQFREQVMAAIPTSSRPAR